MAVLVAVLVLCLAGVTAASMQVRCIDAAREAARLAARGNDRAAAQVARDIAPAGATVQVRTEGGFAMATVVAKSKLLPALVITADGVSAMEPRR